MAAVIRATAEPRAPSVLAQIPHIGQRVLRYPGPPAEKKRVGPRCAHRPRPEGVVIDNQQASQNLDVRDYLRPLWARRYLILGLVVIVTIGTYVYYDRQPDQFSA